MALEDLGAETSLLADIGERPVPVIVIQDGMAKGSDEDIGEAVVVVIGRRDPIPKTPPGTCAFSVTSVKVPSRLFL